MSRVWRGAYVTCEVPSAMFASSLHAFAKPLLIEASERIIHFNDADKHDRAEMD